MFSKFLVCVDDSPLSEQIADVGLDIALRYRAEVVVLSVLDPTRFPSPPYSGLEAIEMVDRYTQTLAHFGQRIRSFFEGMNIPSRLLIVPGRTAETIVEVANQERVNLIVMGGENKSRLRAAFEGSLWGDVARTAPCHVLRVTSKDSPAETPRGGRGVLDYFASFRALKVDPLAS